MKKNFAQAMRLTTEAVRARNLTEAVALIQQAQAGNKDVGDAGADPISTREAAKGLSLPLLDARPRKALGEVVRLLQEGRRLARPPGAPTRLPSLAEGAQFLARSLNCSAGTRGYRLYIPACPTNEIRGLVVMLHGCNQTPEDFAVGTGMNAVAEKNRLLVAYPGQVHAANISGCWNWFDPAHQTRDAGEPVIIAAITRVIADGYGIGPERTFVAGLSAGGAMAAVMAETYPDLYAAVGIHSGLAYGAASDVASAFAAMRGLGRPPGRRTGSRPRRMIVFHGSADVTVNPSNAGDIVASARSALPGGVLRMTHEPPATGRSAKRSTIVMPDGTVALELWMIDGAGHAWSGGDPAGSYTDAAGPKASVEMVRFFLKDD